MRRRRGELVALEHELARLLEVLRAQAAAEPHDERAAGRLAGAAIAVAHLRAFMRRSKVPMLGE